MAQTTDGMSARSLYVGYDVDSGTGFAGTYTDISGYAAAVTPSGAERATAEQYTGDGDTPIIGYGKLAMAQAVLRAVYTNDDDEPFDAIYDAKVNHYPFKLKWSIPGGASGDKEYEVNGYVTECTPPEADAGSADVIMFEATITAPDFDETTAT